MSVLVATAYMEEAEGFDWLVAMDAGKVLATGTPAELMARTGSEHAGGQPSSRCCPRRSGAATGRSSFRHAAPATASVAIEAEGLTRRFGDFTAVDHVSFRIERGEIFGFLGSNGCGKTTTMKMLTGLLPATRRAKPGCSASAVNANDIDTRKRVGYMSQSFSLYRELTVRQNLVLHARLFHVPATESRRRVDELMERVRAARRMPTLCPTPAAGHPPAPVAGGRRGP